MRNGDKFIIHIKQSSKLILLHIKQSNNNGYKLKCKKLKIDIASKRLCV